MEPASPQDVALQFWAQVLGYTISEGPPPPDSALGRLQALERRLGRDLTMEEFIACRNEALLGDDE